MGQPAGVASVGFHLQHIAGVINRLLTYAQGQLLNEAQLTYLSLEGKQQDHLTKKFLLEQLDQQMNKALEQFNITIPGQLTDVRTVGRQQIPTTLLGLLFHAAEHTMRHTGQLLVTAAVVKQTR